MNLDTPKAATGYSCGERVSTRNRTRVKEIALEKLHSKKVALVSVASSLKRACLHSSRPQDTEIPKTRLTDVAMQLTTLPGRIRAGCGANVTKEGSDSDSN